MSEAKNFEFEDGKCYVTPVTLTDPTIFMQQPVMKYGNNIRHCISYLTDHDALLRVLPPGLHQLKNLLSR
jgi:hypothetical protein